MLQNFMRLFKKDEPRNEDILPHTRTSQSIFVDPQSAMNSALTQLGSGIKLSPELQIKFKEQVLKIDKD